MKGVSHLFHRILGASLGYKNGEDVSADYLTLASSSLRRTWKWFWSWEFKSSSTVLSRTVLTLLSLCSEWKQSPVFHSPSPPVQSFLPSFLQFLDLYQCGCDDSNFPDVKCKWGKWDLSLASLGVSWSLMLLCFLNNMSLLHFWVLLWYLVSHVLECSLYSCLKLVWLWEILEYHAKLLNVACWCRQIPPARVSFGA